MIVNGSAPVHINQNDSRDRGEAGYFIRMGYKNILHVNELPKKSTIWK
jgi:hypothetical protein